MTDLTPTGMPVYKVGPKEIVLRKTSLELTKIRAQMEENELRMLELHASREALTEREAELVIEVSELEQDNA